MGASVPRCECLLNYHFKQSVFPHQLENLENERTFSSQGILDILQKVSEFYTKYWKSQEILEIKKEKFFFFFI